MSDNSPAAAGVPDDSKSALASAPRPSARRDRRRDWLIGIVTGVISGVLVSFYLTATGQATWIALRHGFATPTCTNPEWLLQVPDSEVFTVAYYVQKDRIPNYEQYHVASSTVDGDLNTSWLQFWPSPSAHLAGGSSDYVEWSFAQPYDVRL